MPRYVTMHTLACLTRQGAEALTEKLRAATAVKTHRVQINLVEGKMLAEFEAGDRTSLENWLRAEGFHYEWVMRIELESVAGRLEAAS